MFEQLSEGVCVCVCDIDKNSSSYKTYWIYIVLGHFVQWA